MIREEAFFEPDFIDQVFLDVLKEKSGLATIWDLQTEALLSFASSRKTRSPDCTICDR